LNFEDLKDLKDVSDEKELNETLPEDSNPEENRPEDGAKEEQDSACKEGEETPAEGKTYQDLKERVEKLEQEKAELINLSQRVQADFDNFRRRTRGEKEELIKYASEDLITKLLPVLDNFERALAAAKDQSEGKSYYEGVEMIYRQFYQVLSNEGLEVVESLGCPFDPNCHEAVMLVEKEDTPKDTVVEELQKGYRLKGKLIRPSMVKVAK